MESSEKVHRDIETFGWHCLYVFDAKGDKPGFTYSIGFEETFNQPEIVIFGLPRETAHGILTDIASQYREGVTFEPGIRTSNIIGGSLEVLFMPVRQEAFAETLGTAVRYYERPFRAWVMFWPDKNKVLPTESGHELELQDEGIKIV